MPWAVPAKAQAPDGAAVASVAADRVVLPTSVIPRHYDIELRPDAAHLRFSAMAAIRLQVIEPTSTLVLNAAELTIDRAAISGRRAAPRITQDAGRQELSLAFASPLPPGEYTLSIDYRGRIGQQPAGLFALDYDTPKGRRRALFTQFEPADARRLLPCWDEPGRKASFALSVVVPNGAMAVSNMPVASDRAMVGGLRRVAFAPTPPMSAYLLFFALGDFERVHRSAGRTDVGVVVRRGNGAQAQFALDSMLQILPEFNDYFGLRYPLPKLDLVVAPGDSPSFGAMENWGAILAFEPVALLQPGLSTQRDRREIYLTIAHEMAHQWFGDLVTMAWWDDLWLNEGFATWMQNKVAERFHPEWEVWLAGEPWKRRAMALDAGDGTHPIVAPVRDALEASSAFDAITYSKGASVIRMIEAYAGEDAFRAGVRNYMAAHAYSNTVSDDLWREIEASSSAPVLGIAHDFTTQPGVPLVEARRKGPEVSLSQGRFRIDEAPAGAQYWRLPLLAAPRDGELQHLIVTAGRSESVASVGDVLLNSGQTGYFISRYSPELFGALRRRFAQLPAADQLGMLEDTAMLALAGKVPMDRLLSLAQAVPPPADPLIWQALCGQLDAISLRYGEGAGADLYKRWVRGLLAPVFARLGWNPLPEESENTTTLRRTVLESLSEADDTSIIDEARRRFERSIAERTPLAAEELRAVLQIVAVHADRATWDRLRSQWRRARSVLEQRIYLQALGSARDPVLAQRAMDLAISGEPGRSFALYPLQAVSERHGAMAFDFIREHWKAVSALLPSSDHGPYLARFAGASDEPATAARLAGMASAPGSILLPLDVRKAISSIRYLVSIRQQRLPEIDRWLAGAGYAVGERWLLGGDGGWDYLSFDELRQRLFVTRSDRVEVIDTTAGDSVGVISGTPGPHGVAIAQDLRRGFVSNGRGDSVTVFDLDSLEVLSTVPLPASAHNPDAILYEPRNRRIYTFNGRSHDATVFDAATMTVLASLPMPDKPEFAATDGEGRVYVNIESQAGQLLQIDGDHLQIASTWPLEGCESPAGLAIDRAHHRLFSTCRNRVLAITDGLNGRALARAPIGAGSDAAVFDEATATVFSSNGEGSLSVLREASGGGYAALPAIPTQRGARTMALDPATSRLFLISSEFAPAEATDAQQAAAGPARPKPVAGTAVLLVVEPPSLPRQVSGGAAGAGMLRRSQLQP